MKRLILIITLFFLSVYNYAQDDFWSRVNVTILGGPQFASGVEADFYDLSTGYYVGIDARYQLYRFMAIGISAGSNGWSGDVNFGSNFGPNNQDASEISSSKTNLCASFHFGPSAPTWADITSKDSDITDVKPYPPGAIVPYFIFEIGPYFWNWEETGQLGNFEESGSDVMLRGTLAGFYQMSKLFSITFGLSYTLYDFSGDFTATGIYAGARFNVGEIVKNK